jgi:hypothetical protein
MKRRTISWRFLRVVPSLPPFFQGAEFSCGLRNKARNIGPLGRCRRREPWPAPALSGARIYLHDTCYQKNSHIGTFSAPIPVTSLFIRGLPTLNYQRANGASLQQDPAERVSTQSGSGSMTAAGPRYSPGGEYLRWQSHRPGPSRPREEQQPGSAIPGSR